MSDIVPPPATPDQPACLACGSPATHRSDRQVGGVMHTLFLCAQEHLYEVRWTAVSA